MDAETQAVPDFSDIVEGTITTIPLDRLMLSTLNVRQTERAADVDSLAEDIAARGLKQNLVVIPAHFVSGEPGAEQMAGEPLASGGKNAWEGRFEVIAGGRRFQAMQLLVQQERLSATFPVLCMVEYRDAASETSLSENLHRVAMNPADEFEAFRVIVDQARKAGTGEDPIAYCAKRFGVTVKHVQGRLRLASLAPEILTALRHNEIGIESAKAYAGVEDHALQLKVYKDQAKSSWKNHDPRAVRDALHGVTVPLTDPRVKYLGIEAYIEAGGRVEAEMFMGSDGVERVVNVKLLDKLVKEKAGGEIDTIAKADGYKSGLFATGIGWAAKWPKEPKEMVPANSYESEPSKAAKKRSIAVYALKADGSGLERKGRFRPASEVKPAAQERRMTPEERAAQLRRYRIDQRAAQLAAGGLDGIPLTERTEWPAGWCEPIAPRGDGAHVAIKIWVTNDEIEAQRAEAERLIDEEAAAEAESDASTGEFESDEEEAA